MKLSISRKPSMSRRCRIGMITALCVLPIYWTDLHIKSLNVRFEQQSPMISPAPEPDHASMPPLAAAKKL
ncbi:hypothetical protein GGTG_04530 [Gaeumannomyces tritici R3-111a-1]|uniref:Uncharacterized protein n=1 Tax=Gaeumannomyces tritici (strain R3-111a-1) TaxID=644352 RepID=J3NTD1_GAET3|nr:hypothetical protein GGTG_04530 [Gaeumannomyces tritici R3-111a-1]EJT79446.1 hypothetical protein GGTG_04530 [Gaeumannomyces tritici R3-111a-1]